MKTSLYIFTLVAIGSILLLSTTTGLQAQQDEQYTQFMYNKLRYNPAYAGSDEKVTLGILGRNQWVGIAGAPNSQVISFDMPIAGNRAAAGLNLMRNSIGMTNKITSDFSYAYRIPWLNGYIALGASASIRHISTDFSLATPVQSDDDAIPGNLQSKVVPNFGVGLYYHYDNFYVGLSAPRLLDTNIDLSNDGGTISREVQHYYLMGGVILGPDEGVKFFPQALLKYTPDGPFDADLTLNFIFLEKLIVGGGYRVGGSRHLSVGESATIMISATASESLLLGLSYDITLSELKGQNDGSIEGTLRFTFGGDNVNTNTRVRNPRWF